MKHWQELGAILDRLLRPGPHPRPAALAIVTHIEGSAYRRPGAKLLILEDGSMFGGVSGGCLEEDVRQVGLEVLASGRARVRRYDTSEDENKVWGLGLGCDGRVEILVQPVSPEAARGPWAQVREHLQGDIPLALSLLAEDGAPGDLLLVGGTGRLAGAGDVAIEAAAAAALQSRRSRREVIGARQVFTEVLLPPPKLLICGAGDDALPLVALAAEVGFRVTVVDHRSAYLTAERFPDAQSLVKLRPEEPSAELATDDKTYAVLKTHSFEKDRAWVRRLLAAGVAYVGVLGPRARTGRILAELGIAGERVFGPVGLDLGADGPEQVAVSIVAELLAVLAGREPRHLREREVAVHAHA